MAPEGLPDKLQYVAGEPADPTAGMSARDKKMYELQQRLRQSRKANENAVIAEKRRQQVILALCLHARHMCPDQVSISLLGSACMDSTHGFSEDQPTSAPSKHAQPVLEQHAPCHAVAAKSSKGALRGMAHGRPVVQLCSALQELCQPKH